MLNLPELKNFCDFYKKDVKGLRMDNTQTVEFENEMSKLVMRVINEKPSNLETIRTMSENKSNSASDLNRFVVSKTMKFDSTCFV